MMISRFSSVLVATALCLGAGLTLAQQTPPPTPPQTPPAPPAMPAFPPAIVSALDGVALSGVDRTDATLKYVKTLYMPSVPGKVQAVLMFEMSPAELKVEPPAPPAAPGAAAAAPAQPAGTTAAPAPGQPATPPPPPPPIRVDAFFRLTKADAAGVQMPYDDIGIIYEEAAADATGMAPYTVSLPLDPGSYKLTMAISDEHLAKIATARADLTLPDPAVAKGTLETTPIIFAESIRQLDPSARETKATVRKGLFMFSVLEIKPKMDALFAGGDSKEIFYFVFGGRPDLNQNPPKFNLEVTYTLKKGSESVIKFAKKSYPVPLINDPLPLVMQEKEKKLEAGSYVLHIEIEDKVGGGKMKSELPLEIK